jgi:hypothetical protein
MAVKLEPLSLRNHLHHQAKIFRRLLNGARRLNRDPQSLLNLPRAREEPKLNAEHEPDASRPIRSRCRLAHCFSKWWFESGSLSEIRPSAGSQPSTITASAGSSTELTMGSRHWVTSASTAAKAHVLIGSRCASNAAPRACDATLGLSSMLRDFPCRAISVLRTQPQ